jgi:hypothetical protein
VHEQPLNRRADADQEPRPDPMYAEFEVHRTMICDRVRTEALG